MRSIKISQKLLVLGFVASFMSSWTALAAVADGTKKLEATAASSDSRIKILFYDESDVYVIRTKYGYQTNIVFDPQEEIQTISVGDRSLWQIIPSGNRLFIRPLTEDISTNMTLITNKHSYEFDIKSVADKNESNIYVARFVYPEKNTAQNAPMYTAIAAEPAPTPPPAVSSPVSTTAIPPAAPSTLLPVRPNYSYTYSGADALAPSKIYDDGKSTFISYQSINKQLQIPAVFIVGADGKETPAISSVHGSDITVNTVAGEMLLRSNAGEVRIYNEALNPKMDSPKTMSGGVYGR